MGRNRAQLRHLGRSGEGRIDHVSASDIWKPITVTAGVVSICAGSYAVGRGHGHNAALSDSSNSTNVAAVSSSTGEVSQLGDDSREARVIAVGGPTPSEMLSTISNAAPLRRDNIAAEFADAPIDTSGPVCKLNEKGELIIIEIGLKNCETYPINTGRVQFRVSKEEHPSFEYLKVGDRIHVAGPTKGFKAGYTTISIDVRQAEIVPAETGELTKQD